MCSYVPGCTAPVWNTKTQKGRSSVLGCGALVRMVRMRYGPAVAKRTGIRLDDGTKAILWFEPERNVEQLREATAWLEMPLGKTKRGGRWLAAFRLVPDPTGAPVVAEVRVFPDHLRRSPGEWAPANLRN